MSDKPVFEIFTTPVGELVYPWLTRADIRYDPDGVFQTKLLLPFEGAQELIAKLEGVREAFRGTLDAPKNEYTGADVFEYAENEDGSENQDEVLIRFKLKAKVTPREGDPFTQAPVLVDADDGSRIEAPIYGGTMARLKGQIVPYTSAASKNLGVTLRLRAVQVHELVSGDSNGGSFWSDFD